VIIATLIHRILPTVSRLANIDIIIWILPAKGKGDLPLQLLLQGSSRPELKNPHEVKILIHLLLVSRHLERIADQATNIAEDVIYMIEGIIIRHRAEDYTRHD
jgi:hypothetical protein